MTFPEEAAYWTDDADGDPIIAAPAGEVVSVPPPAPARADEPAPVPPPVDALLKLIVEYGGWTAERTEWAVCLMDDERKGAISTIPPYRIKRADEGLASSRARIEIALDALWAAGVEEGRHLERQKRTEERTSELEELVDAFGDRRYELGYAERGGVDQAVVAGLEAAANAAREAITAWEDSARELWLIEGRRQATEERTALVLDTTERTLRTAANWLESDKDSSMLVESANAVKSQGADEACCPVCEEVECDGDCPLATLRTAADGG